MSNRIRLPLNEKIYTQEEATKRAWEQFQHNIKAPWGLKGHDIGIHPINMAIGGINRTKVTTIGARSGVGKTAITVDMFKAAGRVLNGRRAEYLFFTWELMPSLIVERHICNTIGVTSTEFTQGAKLLSSSQKEKARAAFDECRALPVKYQIMSTNISTIKKVFRTFVEGVKAREQEEGIEIIPTMIIDYLNMARFEDSGLRTYGIGDFMNGLKELCNLTGGAAIVLAQLKRTSDDKDVPSRNDFSDSQSIEQASDNLILLHRPEYNHIPVIKNPQTGEEISSENKMLIRTLKSRDCGISEKIINCDIKYYRFWDMNHEWGFPYWELYREENFWRKELNLGPIIEKEAVLL